MEPIPLRPHHLLDIVRDFEPDRDPTYTRAPGENIDGLWQAALADLRFLREKLS